MAENAPRTLICLIEGESQLFKVVLNDDKDIMDLKGVIKENRKTRALSNVDAADLTLWKVRVTMASDSTTNCYIMISCEH